MSREYSELASKVESLTKDIKAIQKNQNVASELLHLLLQTVNELRVLADYNTNFNHKGSKDKSASTTKKKATVVAYFKEEWTRDRDQFADILDMAAVDEFLETKKKEINDKRDRVKRDAFIANAVYKQFVQNDKNIKDIVSGMNAAKQNMEDMDEIQEIERAAGGSDSDPEEVVSKKSGKAQVGTGDRGDRENHDEDHKGELSDEPVEEKPRKAKADEKRKAKTDEKSRKKDAEEKPQKSKDAKKKGKEVKPKTKKSKEPVPIGTDVEAYILSETGL